MDPILLPDSTSNEIESHGFVAFSVAPEPGLLPGAQILNSATIWFDFNGAVQTNTSIFSVDQSTGVSVIVSTSMSAYPNPFTNTTLITFAPTSEGELLIRDALGRVVARKRLAAGSTAVEVACAGLASGVHVASLLDAGHTIGTVRLLVEH